MKLNTTFGKLYLWSYLNKTSSFIIIVKEFTLRRNNDVGLGCEVKEVLLGTLRESGWSNKTI